MPLDNWGTPLRDVLVDAEYRLELGELNSTFKGFYESEGESYRQPYQNIIDRIGRTISKNRIETLKKLFDTLGLLYVKDGVIAITSLGRNLYETWLKTNRAAIESNRQLAEAAVATLGRYQLVNPTTLNRGYLSDADILPYRAIWRAMLDLGGKIHQEEFNRVILKVMKVGDLGAAIQKIRDARERESYDVSNMGLLESIYGPRVFSDEDQVTRRMTPWFSAAGFGGLLIDRESENGYRKLRTEYRDLLQAELSRNITFRDFGSNEAAWFEYLEDALRAPHHASVSASETETFTRAVDLCRVFGNKRIITLSGVAGTGKTRMTEKISIALTNGHNDRRYEIQFHESYSYDDFIEGLVPTPAGGFIVKDKIFRLANKEAHKCESLGPNEVVTLVIEEFSRANLSNVLGEILTYIEHRGRKFRYSLSGEEDYISPNLIIIGTLNPLDRSVVEMDDALIRRTRRLNLPFSDAALREIVTQSGLQSHVVEAVSQTMRSLSNELPFGHGVFVDVSKEEDLYFLWEEQLQHYFVKATGQLHPAYEDFLKLFPWTDEAYRLPPPTVAEELASEQLETAGT